MAHIDFGTYEKCMSKNEAALCDHDKLISDHIKLL